MKIDPTIMPALIAAVVAFLCLVFTGLGSMLWWFVTRTLTKIDKNQTELFNRTDMCAEGLAYLKGQHDNCVVCKQAPKE